jgi:hypothetical protein
MAWGLYDKNGFRKREKSLIPFHHQACIIEAPNRKINEEAVGKQWESPFL